MEQLTSIQETTDNHRCDIIPSTISGHDLQTAKEYRPVIKMGARAMDYPSQKDLLNNGLQKSTLECNHAVVWL